MAKPFELRDQSRNAIRILRFIGVRNDFIDAAKVTRSALQNAGSIAALFLTTEVVIVDKPEPEPAMPMGGGDMDF